MTAQVSQAIKLYAELAPIYDDETRFISGIRKEAIAALNLKPGAILFSYTHDLIRSRIALENLFRQAKQGTRIVATSTKLFPAWFVFGNWYLRYTHRVTMTNFDSFDKPWTLLSDYCRDVNVKITVPGSRYIFSGALN